VFQSLLLSIKDGWEGILTRGLPGYAAGEAIHTYRRNPEEADLSDGGARSTDHVFIEAYNHSLS
jgi:hypothetical protein